MTALLVSYYAIGITVTFGVAVLAYVVSMRRGWALPRWVFIVLIVLPAYLFVAQFLKFRNLHMYADVSHWLEIVHNIATTWRPDTFSHEFVYPGTRNFFSVHFVPLVYLFGFLHRAWSAPEVLLMSNVALMLSSAIPMYLIARKRLGQRMGVCAAVLLLWYPTFQYITLYEFEMLRFSIPILLWMLYFWETRRTALYFLFVVLAVLVREEVGLVVGCWGIYISVFQRARIKGLITTVIGFSFFAAAVTVIMGAFWPAERFQYLASGLFGNFGETPFAIVKNMILHPVAALTHMFTPIKLGNIAMYFIPLLAIPLLAPLVLMSILPNITVGLMSDAVINSSYMLYYLAPSIPFLFVAFLDAWPRIVTWLRRSTGLASDAPVHMAMMSAMVFGILTANVFFGPSPLSLQFWLKGVRPAAFRTQDFHWSSYRVTDHHRAVEELVAFVPTDAIVSTQEFLLSRLYKHRGTMVYPRIVSRDGAYRATYVLLDTTNNGLRPESPAYVADDGRAMVRDDANWRRVVVRGGFELYQRRETGTDR